MDRRPLEFLRRRGGIHLRLLVRLDLAVATGEEGDDRVDVATVLIAADVSDAGRAAALDEVVEAGAAGAAARLGSLAGAELEQLAEQVECLADPLGAREGPEVGAAGTVLFPGEVDPRVLLVEADADVGVGLVVAEADVEARPVALDEALLGEQRLGLGRGDQGLDPVDPRGQPGLAAGEVGGDAFADRARLADVEQLVIVAVEEVDAGRIGQLAALLRDPLGPRPAVISALFCHRPKSRLLAVRPNRGTGRAQSEMSSTETISPPELNTLRLEIDGDIGTLTLDRPDLFNAMSPEMIGEMMVLFAWLADEAPLRALVMTGSGKAFSSGGDINTFRDGVEDDSVDLPSQVRRGAEALHTAIIDLRRIPYPVIAAVNGPAAGAGFSLALACDLRITSSSAFFACAYGRIGASPDGGMTYFLPRIVGPSRATEILLQDPNMTPRRRSRRGS